MVYSLGAVLPDKSHGFLLICVAAAMWIACAFAATTYDEFLWTVPAMAAGFTWGFLVVMSVCISVQNWRVSVNWGAMLPSLLVIPAGVVVTVTPLWGLGWVLRRKGYMA